MSIGTRIKEARQKNKLTQQALANKIGITAGAIGNYENGTSCPKEEILLALMDVLAVDANYLFQDEMDSFAKGRNSNEINSPSQDWGEPILSAYATAARPRQDAVCTVLDIQYVAPYNRAPESEPIPFRISEQPAAAGTGVYLGPESFYEIYVNINTLPKDAIFGIPISGNSMEPKFHNGDIVLISKDEPRIGEIGVFTMDGQGYLKKLGEDALLSLNGAYDPIPMDESIRCNGKVIGTLDKRLIVG